ncbi:MAG: helicase C-terminal domain-containing protein [Promethearchaeota archaeon]
MDFNDYFPYSSYRKQQREVIQAIFHGLQKNYNILFVAPNGTGKTIDNLCAAIPVARDYDLKIIYLCRTHQQSDRVIREVKKINEKILQNIQQDPISMSDRDLQESLFVKALSIRGRSEMCLNRVIRKLKASPSDIMNVCADLRKNKNCTYFNQMIQFKGRLNEDLHDIATMTIDAEELIKFCKQKKYCPYFFTKLLLKRMDIIVCNYQWIFNPNIRETFLEGADIKLPKCILIMDECHNLPEMAAEIDSIRLTKYSITQTIKDLNLYRASIELINSAEAWLKIIEYFEKIMGNEGEEEKELSPDAVLKNFMKKAKIKDIQKLKQIIKDFYDYGLAIYDEKLASGINPIDFIGVVAEFMDKFLQTKNDKRYFLAAVPNKYKSGEISVSIDIICLDPRTITQYIYSNVFATISCSGTIHPESFTKLVGIDQLDRKLKVLEVKSPFPEKNVLVLITQNVNTKGSNRVDSMYKRLIEKIAEAVFATPANLGIFCASYVVLNGLLQNGLKEVINFGGKKLFIEDPNNLATDNAEMIKDFKAESKRGGAVLLGVCGGRNSEGEDFPGDYMNTVIVVGVPYQRPTPKVNAKIKYYNSIFNNLGRLYAYIIPAIQRSNQAAGRPIRKLDDKGAIILMDDRFIRLKNLLSSWIAENARVIPDIPNSIADELKKFFNS